MSLKIDLYNFIKQEKNITYEQFCGFVAREGYKVSYGERQMRHLTSPEENETPHIKPILKISKRGTEYISGYEYTGGIEPKKEPIYTTDVNGVKSLVGYR